MNSGHGMAAHRVGVVQIVETLHTREWVESSETLAVVSTVRSASALTPRTFSTESTGLPATFRPVPIWGNLGWGVDPLG
jgi:hypothetical protein